MSYTKIEIPNYKTGMTWKEADQLGEDFMREATSKLIEELTLEWGPEIPRVAFMQVAAEIYGIKWANQFAYCVYASTKLVPFRRGKLNKVR